MPNDYIRDIHIEYPFYQRMAKKLNGKKSNSTKEGREVYRVQCPACKENQSYMFMGERKNTFMFKCFREKCSLDSLPLHSLIRDYGDPDMFDEWRKKSYIKYENDWLPIKNRKNNKLTKDE